MIFQMQLIRLLIKILEKGPRTISKLFYIHYNRIILSVYRAKLGKNLCLYNRVYIDIEEGAKLEIGDNFSMTSGANFNALSRNSRGCICLERSESCLTIGDDTGMSSPCIWVKQKVTIGSRVKLGADCILMDSDAHSLDYRIRSSKEIIGNKTIDNVMAACAPIVIEDDVLIGARCIILKGVTIGARTVIAAGSIVTKSIPSDCIAGGVPCKVLKKNA